MKVLHVIASLDPATGGPARTLEDFATVQKQQGLDVRVCSQGDHASLPAPAERLIQEGIDVYFAGRGTAPLGWSRKIKPVLCEHIGWADLVHIHGIWEEIQYQACVLSHGLNKPFIVRPAGMLDPWSMRQKGLKKKLYLHFRLVGHLKRATAMHFTAEDERKLAWKTLGFETASFVEPNGIHSSNFEDLPTRQDLETLCPQARDRQVITFLGRLHHKKGLDLLIPAMETLADRRVLLILAGPGEASYVNSLKQKVEEAGLSDSVVFTGMLSGEKKLAALAGADIFVLPSYQENFGVAIIEALACGTPVVISDQINIHESIRQAGVGTVIPTDVTALSEALKHWLDDDQMRLAAHEKARDFVLANYDWHTLARRWTQHYTGILESNALAQ